MRVLRVAALCTVLLPAGALPAQEPYPGLEAHIRSRLEETRVPGVSVAIVRNDSVLYTKGFGVLVAGSNTRVDENTLFEIGSCTKAFTATVIAMLVGEDRMSFDARLSEYLPEFRLADPIANAQVTVRDALSHRSGVGRGELMWLGSGASRAELLHRIRFLEPQSPFRSRYSYQNVMFLAAGEAAGRAAGSSWDALVQQRILQPLGMTATVTTSTGLTRRNVARPHGLERDSIVVKPHLDIDNMAPAGSILSNARDMAQWLRFQLGDGVYGGRRLVDSLAFRTTHTPQILVSGGGAAVVRDEPAVTRFATYAMGWSVQDYRRQLMWQHGGGTDGMSSMVAMLPEQNFGVVVLTNMSAGLANELMRWIVDRELGVPLPDPEPRRVAQQNEADDDEEESGPPRSGTAPPLPLAAYAGTYADSLYGEVTVTVENGGLQLRRGIWHGPLEYWNSTNFRWTILPSSPTGPLFMRFHVAPGDTVTGLYFGFGEDINLLGRKRDEAPRR